MSADERRALATSIASTISDYREGQIDQPTPEHVEKWVSQFEDDVQIPLLREMDHVLERTYFTRSDVEEFLTSLIVSEKLTGDDPTEFWRGTTFLDIQGGGQSQHEMLGVLDRLLQAKLGLSLADCGKSEDSFVYLDDAIFSGNRVSSDLGGWLQTHAPERATVNVICIASYEGSYYARGKLDEAVNASGKSITLRWLCRMKLENRKRGADSSDVLWPTELPDDESTRRYAKSLGYDVTLREGRSVGNAEFFSSPDGRHVLEQELLKAGVRIREMAPNLNEYQRPLGNMVMKTLGFGSMFVTYRNCPNNAPLALWVHDPWYPLFERKTN